MGEKMTKGKVFHYTPRDGETVKVTITTGGNQPALWGVFLDSATIKKGSSTPRTVTVGKAADLHGKTLEVKVVTFDEDDSSDRISARIDIEGVDDPVPYAAQHDSSPDAWLSLNGLYFLA